MLRRLLEMRRAPQCDIHGNSARTVNRALVWMVLASISLVIWHVWVYGPSGHAAPYQGEARSFPLLLGAEVWDLLTNKHGILAELWEVFPYFIVGVLLAGYLRTYKIAVKLQAMLRKYGVLSVFLAAFVGIITPLCACGTLTTAVSLLFAGLPLAPVMALMVTSPLLSPSTYLLTLNDLGPEWTVIRTLSAFSMGIFAGLVTHFLWKRGLLGENLFIEGAIVRGDFHDEDYPDERLRCNCRQKFGNRVAVRTGNTFLVFLAKSAEMVWTVGKYILVGVAIGAIVERYLPAQWIYRFFGKDDPLNIVWVTLGSVPVFLHQISASSILYHIKSSLDGTLDGGVGLAFMIGGPVTAMPTMVLFWSVFKKRVFFLYLFVCLTGTLLIAYGFRAALFVPGVDTGNELLRGVQSLSGGVSAVIRKQSGNVRIVMDPARQNAIATSTNDLEGQGGVVFDGGRERFLERSAGLYDNSAYVGNIARWLEDNGSSAEGRQILIYTLHDELPYLGRGVLDRLAREGYSVGVLTRRTAPQLSEPMLDRAGQLWVFCGGAGPESRLTAAELERVSRFVAGGKGLLVVAGQSPGGTDDLSGANGLATRFGVEFAGVADQGRELPVSVASNLFNRSAELLGRLLKLVHKA